MFHAGVWRSLVARSAGGREVASSNLVTPIIAFKIKGYEHLWMFGTLVFLITFDYLVITSCNVKLCLRYLTISISAFTFEMIFVFSSILEMSKV